MGAVRRFFSDEFQWKKFKLEHENASDFYLSPWQKNRSSLPLLLVRLILFLLSLGIFVSSLTFTGLDGSLRFWALYLTNWGVTTLPIVTGLALAVSCRAHLYGPIDGSTGLPWYVKLYWVSYSVGVTIAFLITIFYWTLLSDAEWSEDIEYAPNATLDALIHGVNSAIMFLVLMTSSQPLNLLHVYMPLALSLVYSVFGAIWYFAGGEDVFGNRFIYPMIDWSNPGPTMIVLLLTLVLFLIVHVIVVSLVVARDALGRCYSRNTRISLNDKT